MRIVAGRFGGRRLETPPGDRTRPTTDRVRESLFSMLEARYELAGVSVLDLFAGSGALGLEALSRGAEKVTFVERDRRACTCIRANISTLDVGPQCTLVCRGVEQYLRASRKAHIDTDRTSDRQPTLEARSGLPNAHPFRIVFADPPYADHTLDLVDSVRPLVEVAGVLVLEHEATYDASTSDYHQLTRRYGRTAISLFEFA